MAERSARVAAVEAAAAGVDWTFAPNVDVTHDARWGRGLEGAGEDVLLSQLMAAARVRGFQGSSLKADDSVAACLKHFAAYGAGEAGLDYNMADVSERTLRQVYLPSFHAGVEAGAATLMSGFAEISGVPATANAWLLTTVLRGEWGLRRRGGLRLHQRPGDDRRGLRARWARRGAPGDPRRPRHEHGQRPLHAAPAGLVASGEVPVARVDQAVRRVLALKARWACSTTRSRRIRPERRASAGAQPEHLAVARDARAPFGGDAAQRGRAPALPTSGKRIALIGPFAEGHHDLIGPGTSTAWTPMRWTSPPACGRRSPILRA